MGERPKIETRSCAPDCSRQRRAIEKLMVVNCVRLETVKAINKRFSVIQGMHEGMMLTSVTAIGEALFNYKLCESRVYFRHYAADCMPSFLVARRWFRPQTQ